MEFALVMPILALFLFGIVQFGIAYDRQQSINSAAREGARLGALQTTDLEDIATRSLEAYGASVAAGTEFEVIVNDSSGTQIGRYERASNGAETYTVAGGGSQSDPEDMPCGDDPQSQFIEVIASTPYDITIPFWGVQAVTIDSEAQFRCE